jgi:hypothetical protein
MFNINDEKIKTFCIVLVYFVMSIFVVLKNNEKETKIHLPPIVDYVFQCINGVLLFVAFNIKKIKNVLELNVDDKELLNELKNNQMLLNENVQTMLTHRSHPNSTTGIYNNTEPITEHADYITIPRNLLLNHRGNVQCGDYLINIKDTARD